MAEVRIYEKFYVNKSSGTYSETLEAFGLANLIDKILDKNNVKRKSVLIKESRDGRYLVQPNSPISEEMINNLKYFQVIKFIKKEPTTKLPDGIGVEFFDYPEQKKIYERYKAERNEAHSLLGERKKNVLNEIKEKFSSEFGKAMVPEFDVIREIKRNPYAAFNKIYQNFYQNRNQSNFRQLIIEILAHYSKNLSANGKLKLTKKITSQQLYSPHQGKGLNKFKANNISMSNLHVDWIPEAMKVSGALNVMVCQYVKAGSGYDLKIYVPDFNEISFAKTQALMFQFRKNLNVSSPLKLDILNLLSLIKHFILNSEEYKDKVKDTIKGLHSVYQKDLGQNKAIANISFLEVPGFIEYDNKTDAQNWIEFINYQQSLISGIEERGDAIQGLQAYRNFISGGNIQQFFNFSRWYSIYLMQSLVQERNWVKPFTYNILNQIFNTMENKLQEIIKNEGFQAVAKAIRYSTVKIQYNKKYWSDQLGFQPFYGLAQQLGNKSRSSEDLVVFIGEFIGKYNSETARTTEIFRKNNPKAIPPRANVRQEDLNNFYQLFDNNSARLIGSLLSSFGFALPSEEGAVDKEGEKN